MTKIFLGQKGEQLVADYLVAQGFQIMARNYRRAYGEIDLIAEKDELLVFVEVKLRSHVYFDLSEVITASKQRRIILTAKDFLARYTGGERVCRFDVALINNQDGQLLLDYIANAFQDSSSDF